MARRASSGIKPGLLIGIAALVAIAFFGGKFFLGKQKDTYANMATINMSDVMDGVSLRDNEYVVEGTVDDKFFLGDNPNQVVSLKVDTNSGDQFLGVEIPANLAKSNIERSQRYRIKVRIREAGIAVATGINPL
ncbi:hypothetical protein OKA04_22975 [Luteolibacter flavescens]|uniref:MCE family protein n=1 Tax=Luteolibacter flavescens TaxID=1859460 RepID=A0ABT3FVL4_9BACT|nr:hypothetical protein [Luteolibacter flavescens]MCW1887619.1 hypothetical protein [Luteolibacter flavescens]